MSAYFGPAGNSESFATMKFKGTLDVPKYIEAMGLDAYEYQCGRGVNIGEDKAVELGRLAAEKDIRYFIKNNDLPLVENRCPEDKRTEREEMKKMLAELDRNDKGLKHRIFGAIKKAHIDGY